MKFKSIFNWRYGQAACVVALAVVFAGSLAYASRSTWFRRDVVRGSMVHVLENDGTTTKTGASKFGSDETTPVIPSTTNAANFGIKIPFYNASGAATAQGTIIIASATTNNAFYGSYAAVLATTSVLGVCDGVYANGVVGWMTVSGYALVLTTGTVAMGNVIVTTGTIAGYGGATAAPTSGTDVGVAVASTNVQGLTPIRLR